MQEGTQHEHEEMSPGEKELPKKAPFDDLSDLFEEESEEGQPVSSLEKSSAEKSSQEKNSSEEASEKETALPSPLGPTHHSDDDSLSHHGRLATSPAAQEVSIEELPIQVSLEVGTHTTTLGDLLELQEGQVLELGETLGEELRLLVDGHCIGRAEVVTVGGKTGIRILELASNAK